LPRRDARGARQGTEAQYWLLGEVPAL
jgi:hypothetical protein